MPDGLVMPFRQPKHTHVFNYLLQGGAATKSKQERCGVLGVGSLDQTLTTLLLVGTESYLHSTPGILWNSVIIFWKMPGVVFHYMDYVKHVKSGNANICTYPRVIQNTILLFALYNIYTVIVYCCESQKDEQVSFTQDSWPMIYVCVYIYVRVYIYIHTSITPGT